MFTNRRHYYSSGHCKCSAVLSSPNAALALANKNRIKRLDEAKGRLMAFYKKQGQKANKIAREHIRDKMESISSDYQSRLSVLERVLKSTGLPKTGGVFLIHFHNHHAILANGH